MTIMQSKAATVEEYLAELPDDRREAISAVRDLVNRSIQPGFAEVMQYGMIGWVVPHAAYPAGYHCDPKQPVNFISLANQKGHMSLYLMCLYLAGPRREKFEADYAQTGKKIDMGKSCLRFKKLDDLALDVVSKHIGDISLQGYIDTYASLDPRNKKK